eukprot:CAMPEP_0171120836 /NCGR_PEP_ID=MMETSP0766_2-20121228/100756_1 /TAXON_ID=439317 /ORGANISM="Gambierdiscus australes, Strain CAWD 149" /LENGTH=103 /DNA_ID=CAMNT_0011583587 /DNA_START=1 /DNA_END=309 /DNA_ORIENTATION=-
MRRFADLDTLLQCLQPALVQVAFSLLQLAAALVLARGTRVAEVGNAAITAVEAKLNDHVNRQIQEAASSVMESAFDTVRGKADPFFSKFKEGQAALRQVLTTA